MDLKIKSERELLLQSLMVAGVAASLVERRLKERNASLNDRNDTLTATEENSLKRATKTANYVNYVIKQFSLYGVDCRVNDLSQSIWPNTTWLVTIVEFLIKYKTFRDHALYESAVKDNMFLDLSQIEMATFDCRAFNPKNLRKRT
jgi:hypothetical protein